MRFRRRINRITAVLVCLAVALLPAAAVACVHAGAAGTEHTVAGGAVHDTGHCTDPADTGGTAQSCSHCFSACAASVLAAADGGAESPRAAGHWAAAPLQILASALPAPPHRPPRGA